MANNQNVILITTDQQRFDTIQALGNDAIYTPHLNWLCDEGITFNDMYADCPICLASRTTIMTGVKGYVSGMCSNGDLLQPAIMQKYPSLPKVLTENGYQTKAVGKMHFYPVRAHHGFEHIELPMDYYRMMKKLGGDQPKEHGIGENEIAPVISTVDDQHSLTHWTVERSIDFLETKDPTKPFFLWTSFAKPHPPFDPCANYWNLYETADMPLPVKGDWSQDVESMPKGFLQHTYLLNNVHRFTDKQKQASKRAYYACISHIDYNLGLLLARLRELNLFDNTWIIFTSDHGEMLGDHNMGAKMTFFEGAAHVPMIIKPPVGHPLYKSHKGKRISGVNELSSIYNTILDMVGIEQKEYANHSLLDFEWAKQDKTYYGACESVNYAVMEGGFKYIYTRNFGDEVLFNLKEDPYEQHNLAVLPEYAEKRAELRAKLYAWAKEYEPSLVDGDDLAVKEGFVKTEGAAHWPGYHSKTWEDADVLH